MSFSTRIGYSAPVARAVPGSIRVMVSFGALIPFR